MKRMKRMTWMKCMKRMNRRNETNDWNEWNERTDDVNEWQVTIREGSFGIFMKVVMSDFATPWDYNCHKHIPVGLNLSLQCTHNIIHTSACLCELFTRNSTVESHEPVITGNGRIFHVCFKPRSNVSEPMAKRCTAEQQSSVQALDIVIQRVAQCPDPNLLRDYVETEVQHNVWESSLTLNHTLRDKLQEKRQSMNHTAIGSVHSHHWLWKFETSSQWKCSSTARYHDAVYDTCYFFFFWKIPHKWPKKDRYHDAVNDTCDNTSLVKCLQTFATEPRCHHVLDVKNRTVWVQDHKMSYRDTLQKLLYVKASVYESVCVCKSICV